MNPQHPQRRRSARAERARHPLRRGNSQSARGLQRAHIGEIREIRSGGIARGDCYPRSAGEIRASRDERGDRCASEGGASAAPAISAKPAKRAKNARHAQLAKPRAAAAPFCRSPPARSRDNRDPRAVRLARDRAGRAAREPFHKRSARGRCRETLPRVRRGGGCRSPPKGSTARSRYARSFGSLPRNRLSRGRARCGENRGALRRGDPRAMPSGEDPGARREVRRGNEEYELAGRARVRLPPGGEGWFGRALERSKAERRQAARSPRLAARSLHRARALRAAALPSRGAAGGDSAGKPFFRMILPTYFTAPPRACQGGGPSCEGVFTICLHKLSFLYKKVRPCAAHPRAPLF